MNPSSNKLPNTVKIFRNISTLLLFLLTLACIISFTSGYESDIRYFVRSLTNLPLATVAVLTLLLSISSAVLFKDHDTLPHANPNLRLVSILPTIAIIRAMIHIALKELTRLSELIELGRDVTLDTWTPLLLLTALFAVIYNLLEIFPLNKILKLVCGLLQIIFCIVVIANLYIDFSVELNSPAKLLLQFSASSMIIYTLAGIRRELKIPNAPILMASSLATAAFGVANAVALFAEFIPNADKYNGDYSVYPLIFIAYGIKAAIDLFTCSTFKCEQEDRGAVEPTAEAEPAAETEEIAVAEAAEETNSAEEASVSSSCEDNTANEADE